MNATEFGTWEMQAGSPGVFAFRLAFLLNPHGADDLADDDMRESWGSFIIWTRGENLCAHVEQGEVVDSAHWYLLPLMEWLADNWDPLLHEERLPLRNCGSVRRKLSQPDPDAVGGAQAGGRVRMAGHVVRLVGTALRTICPGWRPVP